jgi:hypothetical protein
MAPVARSTVAEDADVNKGDGNKGDSVSGRPPSMTSARGAANMATGPAIAVANQKGRPMLRRLKRTMNLPS